MPIPNTVCLLPGCNNPQRKRGATILEYCSTAHYKASREKVHHISDDKLPAAGADDATYDELAEADLTGGADLPTCFHLCEGGSLQNEAQDMLGDEDLCDTGYACACCTYRHGGAVAICTVCGSSTTGAVGKEPASPFPKPKKGSRRERECRDHKAHHCQTGNPHG